MAGFVTQLDAVNALAEASPGFVWRLKAGEGANSSYVRAYDDERIIVNMTVWESLDALQTFVYRGDHASVLRARRQWFEPLDGPALALWWVPAGEIPDVEQGKLRLKLLSALGPTSAAFTFNVPFPPP